MVSLLAYIVSQRRAGQLQRLAAVHWIWVRRLPAVSPACPRSPRVTTLISRPQPPIIPVS